MASPHVSSVTLCSCPHHLRLYSRLPACSHTFCPSIPPLRSTQTCPRPAACSLLRCLRPRCRLTPHLPPYSVSILSPTRRFLHPLPNGSPRRETSFPLRLRLSLALATPRFLHASSKRPLWTSRPMT